MYFFTICSECLLFVLLCFEEKKKCHYKWWAWTKVVGTAKQSMRNCFLRILCFCCGMNILWASIFVTITGILYCEQSKMHLLFIVSCFSSCCSMLVRNIIVELFWLLVWCVIWWIQIKDCIENALKQLSIGTFFSEPSSVTDSEQNVDNNLSARLAAQITGFTDHHLSMECVPCDSSQKSTKPPLCLEERGWFSATLHFFSISAQFSFCESISVHYQFVID